MEYKYKTQLVDVDLSPIADLVTDHFMVRMLNGSTTSTSSRSVT
jgi:hypothetical protein